MPFSVNVDKINALEKKVMEYGADPTQPRPVSNLLKQRPHSTFADDKPVFSCDITRGFAPDGIRFLQGENFDHSKGEDENEKLIEDVQSRLSFPTYSQAYSNVARYIGSLLLARGNQLFNKLGLGFFPFSSEKLTGGAAVKIKQRTLLTGFDYFSVLIDLSSEDSVMLTGEIFACAETLDDGAHYVSIHASNQLLRALLEHDYESALSVYGLEILTANNEFRVENFKRAIAFADKENQQLQDDYQQEKEKWKDFLKNDFPQNRLLHFIDCLIEAHHPEGEELISCPAENRYSKQFSCIQPVYSACIDTAMATAIYRDLPKIMQKEKSLQECPELMEAIEWCGDPSLSYAMQACLIALEKGIFKNPVFVQVLNSEIFGKVLRNEAFAKALSNEFFVKALNDAAFINVLNNEVFIKALSNDVFVKVFSTEAFAKALSNKAFVSALNDEVFLEILKNDVFAEALSNEIFAKVFSTETFANALSNKAFVTVLNNKEFLKFLSTEAFAKAIVLSKDALIEALGNEAFINALNNEAFVNALDGIYTAKMTLEAELSKWKSRGKKSMYAYLQPQLQKAANTLTTTLFAELFSAKEEKNKERDINNAVNQYNNTCRKVIKKIERHDQQYAIKCGVLFGALAIAAVAIIAIVLPWVLPAIVTLPVDIFAAGTVDMVLTAGIITSIGTSSAVALTRPRRKEHKDLRKTVKEKTQALSDTIDNKISRQLKLFFSEQKADSLEDALLEKRVTPQQK